MHPLSDKDLDRLSREAADHYDVEQSTSGWDKLEQKLNKHLPEKGKKERRRFIFFIWLFALISGGGLVWMLSSTHSSRTITLKEGVAEVSPKTSSQEVTQAPSSTTPDSEFQNESNKDVSTTLSDKHEKDRTPQNTNRKKTSTQTADKGNTATVPLNNTSSHGVRASGNNLSTATKNDKVVVKETTTRKSKAVRSGKKNSNVKDLSSATLVPPVVEKRDTEVQDNEAVAGEQAVTEHKERKDGEEPRTNPTDVKEKSPTPDSASGTADEVSTAVDSNKVENKLIRSKANGFRKGLQIGIVGAPDMSNVKFTNTDKVGYNVGLQVAYRLSQRWSVNTGVIYTRKNYTSQGKDFNPPKGSWLDNVTLDMVTGYCEMFDIPLNVRYDLNSGPRHRYFVSAGVSTYLMKNEEYHYHYQYPNGNPGYRSRSFSSDENHFLSVLNISAGFEKKIGKRLSLQAEPYFKVPLAGLGYGNLRLNSYGMYFMLRFHTKQR